MTLNTIETNKLKSIKIEKKFKTQKQFNTESSIHKINESKDYLAAKSKEKTDSNNLKTISQNVIKINSVKKNLKNPTNLVKVISKTKTNGIININIINKNLKSKETEKLEQKSKTNTLIITNPRKISPTNNIFHEPFSHKQSKENIPSNTTCNTATTNTPIKEVTKMSENIKEKENDEKLILKLKNAKSECAKATTYNQEQNNYEEFFPANEKPKEDNEGAVFSALFPQEFRKKLANKTVKLQPKHNFEQFQNNIIKNIDVSVRTKNSSNVLKVLNEIEKIESKR